MPREPLLLPPPAVLTSPSRSRRSSSSIIAKSPSRRPSPSSCHRAVQRHSAATSTTVNSPSCRPLLPIAVVLSSHHRRAHAIPRHRGAVARHTLPSRSRRADHCRQGAVAPYHAIKEPAAVSTDNSGHSSRPSQVSRPAGCRVASPHAAPSHLPAPLIAASSFVPLVRTAGCPVSSLLTPPPPICRCLRLSLCRCLLSHPSGTSRPAS